LFNEADQVLSWLSMNQRKLQIFIPLIQFFNNTFGSCDMLHDTATFDLVIELFLCGANSSGSFHILPFSIPCERVETIFCVYYIDFFIGCKNVFL
jgi:hypothetical protein